MAAEIDSAPNADGRQATLSQEVPKSDDGQLHKTPCEDIEKEANSTQSSSPPTPPESHDVYNRFPESRKSIITAVLSYCGFLIPISSTAVLSAVPEVASTFHTTGTVINISNALFLVFMAFGPLIWAPLASTFGRRLIILISSALLTAFSIGTALAPNLAAFFVFRMLSAVSGIAAVIVGTVIFGDIYAPEVRGTAVSWFLSGALIGPAIGPIIGGAIVTYTSWRVIFWVQTGLAALSVLLITTLIPETTPEKKTHIFHNLSLPQKSLLLLRLMNPTPILTLLLTSPNLLIVALAISALLWNMYSLLTPIRYVPNPRFNLTSPQASATSPAPSSAAAGPTTSSPAPSPAAATASPKTASSAPSQS